MWNTARKLIAILALALALLSLPAAASDNRTNVGSSTQSAGATQLAGPNADLRLLMIDRDLYPTTYEDHAYICSEGNCTDW